MVKGVARRVVVVKSPDPKVFEQAIFLMREDADGAPEEAVLKQAQEVANAYLLRTSPQGKRRRWLAPLFYMLVGCLLSTLTLTLFF